MLYGQCCEKENVENRHCNGGYQIAQAKPEVSFLLYFLVVCLSYEVVYYSRNKVECVASAQKQRHDRTNPVEQISRAERPGGKDNSCDQCEHQIADAEDVLAYSHS